jgi:hypothetical protein
MMLTVGDWVTLCGEPKEPLLRAIEKHNVIAQVIATTADGRYVLDIRTSRGAPALKGIVVDEENLRLCDTPAWAQ